MRDNFQLLYLKNIYCHENSSAILRKFIYPIDKVGKECYHIFITENNNNFFKGMMMYEQLQI